MLWVSVKDSRLYMPHESKDYLLWVRKDYLLWVLNFLTNLVRMQYMIRKPYPLYVDGRESVEKWWKWKENFLINVQVARLKWSDNFQELPLCFAKCKHQIWTSLYRHIFSVFYYGYVHFVNFDSVENYKICLTSEVMRWFVSSRKWNVWTETEDCIVPKYTVWMTSDINQTFMLV